jgi:alpha-D-ribose 1-methylphosphonate 5-triphosphate diphosphatase
LSTIKPKDRSLVALDSSYGEMRTHEEPGRPVGRLGLHLRRELCGPDIFSVFRGLVENPLVQLVSVMDRSPGQRQSVLESKYREYLPGARRECVDGHTEHRARRVTLG